MTELRKISKHHVRQQDQSDCGVACLRSVLRHFGSDASLERLREISGTSRQGTTMLGLYQAAASLGLEVVGYEAGMDNLRECKDVCILHIVKEGRFQHYVVYYGYDADRDMFLIGDPAEPAPHYRSASQLASEWLSKSLLLLKPTGRLERVSEKQHQRWHWIKNLLREDIHILGIALAFGVAVSALGLATAVFSQQLIDKIIPSGDSLRLYAGAALLLLLLLARSGLGYLRQLLLLRQNRDFNIRVIDYFYNSLLFLPKAFFDNRKTGDLVARMNDTQRIQHAVSRLAENAMIDVVMVIVASVAIFSYDSVIGAVALLWVPVFVAIVWRFHRPILDGQQDVMKAYALNESHYIDTMLGIGEIKSANKQSVFTKITNAVYGYFQQKSLDLGKIGIRFGLVTETAGAVFITGIIAWSASEVLGGNLSTGGMMAVLQLVGILMGSAGQLAATNIQLQEAKVAFDRMFEFTNLGSEYDEEEEQPKAQIRDLADLRVQHLAFRFPGRKRLLEDVSFEVKKGEMVAILGESGCGKSTLLQILQKFYAPESGKIKVNGIDLDMAGFVGWRNITGSVPQQVKLFNGTLIENILLGDAVSDVGQLEEFFQYYGFHRYFSQLPHGYATIIGEGGVNLSGGQQQIVALARALYRKPQLLLLDEPTSALDRHSEAFVLGVLEAVKPHTAIVVATHRLKTARKADRIYVIEQGKTEVGGTHAELLQSDNFYSRGWNELSLAI